MFGKLPVLVVACSLLLVSCGSTSEPEVVTETVTATVTSTKP